MNRVVLDPKRSTWMCFCRHDAPPGVSQCPVCGGVTFNHAEFREAWARRLLAALRKRL